MSTSPDQRGPASRYREDAPATIEAVADKVIALLEEFEATLREGQVPRDFADRLAELRQTAERLIER